MSIFPLNEIIFTDKRKYILKTNILYLSENSKIFSNSKKKYILLNNLELLTFEQLKSAEWNNQKHLNF